MSAQLLASNLTKSFGELRAVDGISLAVETGQCLALLGPNGAGKTTTVELLEGLQRPDSGSVTIFGKDLAKERKTILQDLGVVLQETSLYKKFTVRETLDLFASFYSNPRDVTDVIAELDLNEKAEQRLEKLSGGQKQRVYIGCGLINGPKLLFLDEPTTGLDPQARRSIWDLVAKLKKAGCSILLTTHYMEEAEYLADSVAIIDHGKVITSGPPKKLIRDVCGEQILWFSAPNCDAREVLQRANIGWVADLSEEQGGYALVTPDAIGRVAELKQAFNNSNHEIENLQIRTCTLEDVFLKLTGRSMRDA